MAARIPAAEFRSFGEPLATDQQINIDHVLCPAGLDTKKRLYIRRKSDCILAYCHNCGGHGFVSLGNKVKRLEELLKDNEELVKNGTPEIELPLDTTCDWDKWPVAAKAWLMRYYVTQSIARRWGIGYSESMHRVILPVFNEDGQLIFWQGRALYPSQSPKYISVKAVDKPLFKAHGPRHPHHNSVVIVEDMLSAIRISEHTDAIALLGTSADTSVLRNALAGYKDILIWLDPDMPGRTKAQDLKRIIHLCTEARVLVEDYTAQPKELNSEQLFRIIHPWT